MTNTPILDAADSRSHKLPIVLKPGNWPIQAFKPFKPFDELPFRFTKPRLLESGICIFPPVLYYGYPTDADYDPVDIFDKYEREVHRESSVVIGLGSSKRVASREEIDRAVEAAWKKRPSKVVSLSHGWILEVCAMYVLSSPSSLGYS